MTLYAVTIFLGAFLLFQVELVIAKYLLPWFGGSPAVWTTCMLFFQALLVGGYAYAHGLVSRTGPRRQGTVHLAVLAGSLCVIAFQWVLWRSPVLPGADWKPPDGSMPVLRILALLGISVGLPFLVLSSTSSLMQAWFSRTHPGRSPYWLFSLSNAGSLLGLVSYPFLVEPTLPLRGQALMWTGGFTVFAACCVACALRAMRGAAPVGPSPAEDVSASPVEEARISRWTRLAWLGLPAIASVLLLATTNKISEEVSVFPFLWVVTLAAYLLSFILCFGGRRVYRRAIFIPLGVLAWGVVAGLVVLYIENRTFFNEIGVVWTIAAYTFALFISCMLCHGELYRLRPRAARLTSYYLAISVGGALGGIFVAVVAPVVFNGPWELGIGYAALAAAMLAVTRLYTRSSGLPGLARWPLRAVGCAVLAAVVIVPLWEIRWAGENVVVARRNFYGVLSVEEEYADDPAWHCYTLCYGGTVHGYQYRNKDRSWMPTSYYTAKSGISLAIENHPNRLLGRMRIGVLGLGTGTMAAFSGGGDRVRFYEINPAMVDLARNYFTYIEDNHRRVEAIIMGDARISLERELREGEPQNFDVLAADAFSGDAVPVHLITLEAFKVYLGHLRPDGILAVHVSNRYFNLAPVVWRLADELGLHGVRIDSDKDLENGDAYGATWMLLSRDASVLEAAPIADAASWRNPNARPSPLWTDAYSNLFKALDPSEFALPSFGGEPADEGDY